tara:strand:+ start:271 stop:1035 length:765 start_codon:yes stop_codon:yes gene_type:complete
MAKKKAITKGFSVEEKLKALCKLQIIDSEIDKIRTVRGELPLEVRDLEDDLKGLETRLLKIDSDLEEKEKFINSRKLSIKESEELIKKYNSQLASIKNNREYDSLSKEIEFQNLEIELSNKKINDTLSKIDFLNQSKEDTSNKHNEKREIFEEKNKELKNIVSETEKEEKLLLKKSEEAEIVVDERLLIYYKKVRENSKNGLAVVPIRREACGGCFSKIPPQKQLDIRARNKIIVCEHCGRILVDLEMYEAIAA